MRGEQRDNLYADNLYAKAVVLLPAHPSGARKEAFPTFADTLDPGESPGE